MSQPGTGCQDAPRAFSIKLGWATNDLFGAQPIMHDEQTIVRHKNGKLDMVATKHVDDVKAAAEKSTILELIRALEEIFGKGEIDITMENFTACGVRSTRLTCGGYRMDQRVFVNGLKPIVHNEMVGAANDAPCSTQLGKLFLSLLMQQHSRYSPDLKALCI